MISYRVIETLSVPDFVDILERSNLAERRPTNDHDRLKRMIDGASLVVGAFEDDSGKLVGIARALTDFAYCCYLSDLAVDKQFQGQGIGKALIEVTRRHAGPEAMCLLVSSPDAETFYNRIAMPRTGRAFLHPRQR